ncbi:vitamin K-dependent gamma-carboxylase-like [Ostrea edulis]|uniref:vitamin K-dependent gamma-carboxylase-like n=1 Tax=Ostrea edulis TaxID=37623 RepID=UPI0024AEADE7|nr:vitamin K-dependent gamma-carboxylase-like [Ostrea edulis]XP_048762583.2 vitamin K-dependent gamma-carboxylase-like [Ostrea edulis]
MMKDKGGKRPMKGSSASSDRNVDSYMISPSAFFKYLCRPTDPANLAVLRIAFGILMMFDIPQERGMSHADVRWGRQDVCRFPLFNSLKVAPLQWMYIIYLVMFLGALGITLGLFYRTSCLLFSTTYWYVILLDKTSWNNHSYLYGLIAILLMTVDGNRWWSLDGLLNKSISNSHVPFWNYFICRTQIFLVYFIAGLKKLDLDWITGYSMQRLSRNWVFDPFRLVLTDEQIDLFIVHICGLTVDMFGGVLLLFDRTRPIGILILSSFHIMNSTMFSIGMFPYAMLATLPLFCSADWPKKIIFNLPKCLQFLMPKESEIQPSSHCIYDKEDIKPEEDRKHSGKKSLNSKSLPPTSPLLVHKMGVIFTVLHIAVQLFLPYSHGITKGYNNWTNGLYGYSWDMMVHSWTTQHIRLSYKDKISGKEGYLDPTAFVDKFGRRWSSHGDMVVQYAHCVADILKNYNMSVELYFDIWKSMNKRFQQRMFDPRINIVDVEWSPFKEVTFALPLLVDLSPWRSKLAEMESKLIDTSNYTDVVFVADFPELHLEAFIQEDLGNTSITLLSGSVIVEFVEQKKNFSLNIGDKIQVPPGQFHKVYTVSEDPSCYMYIYVNTTYVEIMEKVEKVEKIISDKNISAAAAIKRGLSRRDPYAEDVKQEIERRNKETKEKTFFEKAKELFTRKMSLFTRSWIFLRGALESVVLQTSFEEFLNKTYSEEAEPSSPESVEQVS